MISPRASPTASASVRRAVGARVVDDQHVGVGHHVAQRAQHRLHVHNLVVRGQDHQGTHRPILPAALDCSGADVPAHRPAGRRVGTATARARDPPTIHAAARGPHHLCARARWSSSSRFSVLPQFSGARHSLHLLATVNPILVVFAVLCETAAIYAYVELTASVLYPYSPSRFNLLRVNLAGLAISHVVPGGTAPAGALSYRIFNELGVPKETNAFGLATQGSGSAVVLNIMFWSALVVSIPLRGFNPAYGFAALAGVFLLSRVLRDDPSDHEGSAPRRQLAARPRAPRAAHQPRQAQRLLAKVAERITLLINNRRTLWWAFMWAASTGCSTRRACGCSSGPSATPSRRSTCSSPTASPTSSRPSPSPPRGWASSRRR